jgi:3-dehydroquinate synthase
MIGAFHQPVCVLIDTDTLKTLPNKDFISGLAEVIKYGLMADYVFFQWLEANFDKILQKENDSLEYIIKVSCENKAKIVSEDEMEHGRRALLNFGHTFGHAIEAWQQYSGLSHGEAVAVGMSIAAALSLKLGLIAKSDYLRVISILKIVGLPTQVPDKMKNTDFLDFMRRDKKNTDNKINLILLSSLGCGVCNSEATESEIFSAIDMQRSMT